MLIPIAKPQLGKEEKKAVLEVLNSGILAQGDRVREFEELFAKFVGTKYAVATSNGTTALHLSLLALGIGQGDEVITTPFTFIASANSILYTGAKPIFVDIDEDTFNINPDLIERSITSKTKAILPVHLFGLPSDMGKIRKIAKKYNLYVIEDACQAHGAKIANHSAGSIGDVGCFSFYPTKNMTTGEGGIVTTNNKKLADKTRLLREHGMKIKYHHDVLGYNFRMTNLAAAIGICQLKKLPAFNKKRIQNAKYLSRYLTHVHGIKIPKIPENHQHVFHQYTIRVDKDYRMSRDKLILHLHEKGIGSSVHYPIPVNKQKVYKDFGVTDKLPVAEKAANEVLSLPVHPGLTKRDLDKIIAALK